MHLSLSRLLFNTKALRLHILVCAILLLMLFFSN
jgi:hypothetical protein